MVPEPAVQAEVAEEEGRRESPLPPAGEQVGQAGREGGRWGAPLLAEGQMGPGCC